MDLIILLIICLIGCIILTTGALTIFILVTVFRKRNSVRRVLNDNHATALFAQRITLGQPHIPSNSIPNEVDLTILGMATTLRDQQSQQELSESGNHLHHHYISHHDEHAMPINDVRAPMPAEQSHHHHHLEISPGIQQIPTGDLGRAPNPSSGLDIPAPTYTPGLGFDTPVGSDPSQGAGNSFAPAPDMSSAPSMPPVPDTSQNTPSF